MAGVGKRKTSPAAIRVDRRQAAAVNLRLAGASFEAIASELGYASQSGAYEAVKAAMKKTLREPCDELRQVELSRLDVMQESVWDSVLGGDLDAIATVLRISERRARLLGLDQSPPLVAMAVSGMAVGSVDFSGMTNAELRERIKQEAEEHDGDTGIDAAGTGAAQSH